MLVVVGAAGSIVLGAEREVVAVQQALLGGGLLVASLVGLMMYALAVVDSEAGC